MSMFDIGLSGLKSNSLALTVTAQNTANVNNAAYSRQVVDQSAVIYGGQGSFVIGSGVQVDSIRRVADTAVIESLRLSHESYGYASTYSYGMDSIEGILGADGLNITSGLNEFFAAIDEASVTPESVVLRQQVINAAGGLASQFGDIISQMEKAQSELSSQYSQMTDSVNMGLANVAELNSAIKSAQALGQNTSGLKDSLDKELQNLSGMIGIHTVNQPDGTIDISLSNGQPLVIGDEAATLSLAQGNGSYGTALNLEFAGQTSPVYAKLGGQMGAIVDVMANEFEPIKSTLDDMAAAFADQVNGILEAGYDLNGTSPGAPLFTYNPDDPAASLSITDIKPEELALSSDGSIGNGDILTQLSGLSSTPLGEGSVANVSMYDAYSQMIGGVGVSSLKATSDKDTALSTLTEAQTARNNISGVNSDEEAANLMMYINAYEANMKVISTANQMFQTVLGAF
ncbi:flagellar hook-associated protein FlgK [Vibrio sp. B1FLJ16]|uniref:flagellar hook-associated protein FlgK n=1 Tax=Vibrio sp. B1FLJ16 TaxID=2751178 RepID=UPI0015F6BE4B|nr:flagellar hook-associated protein FlgK [Vibrio sp. B1FLJ16]CAD7811964.1 flagellar hook-associated protein [Vibrio sp. B1FLJ16]CAE6917655.1 flagellar hook-associated protein [Vibrio sp. B1FLJ16]